MTRHFIFWLSLVSVVFAAQIESKDLIGKRLSLVDKKRVEIYVLGKNGIARVTIGAKDRALAGPIWSWKIDDGQLVFFEGKSVKERFEVLERKERSLKLRRRDGAVVIFDVEDQE